MDIVKVELGPQSYEIHIGRGAREKASEDGGGRRLTVTDRNVDRIYGSWIDLSIGRWPKCVIPAGEENKTFEVVADICGYAAREHFDRKSCFVAVGGGVTGDITGFAAAIYMRGVDFIQIPTTLLAMVDSSVGGKTGVDLPEGKNLIGAFHQPKRVLIDPVFLETLPVREIRAGLAEIVKTAVILDADLFGKLEREAAKLLAHPGGEEWIPFIRRSCECKAMVVAADEKETGLRAILNYGHTFGHAVETLSNFAINHGEGVSIGMCAAAELAVERGEMKREEAERQRRLLEAIGLPTRIPHKLFVDDLLELMRRDKKCAGGRCRVVLPAGLGKAGTVEPEAGEIRHAMEAIHD